MAADNRVFAKELVDEIGGVYFDVPVAMHLI